MSAGRIVASRYCLLYELGRGGMGAVWAAEHLTLRSKVAVKLIDATLTTSAEAIQRFEREARAAAALRSPHVVQVLDFGVDGGSPYLVMELLSGESLGERLFRDHVLPPRDVALVMEQLARAVTRAHAAGFVHRDLKPDNVFLVDDAPDFFVKVLDFGIAKSLRPTPTESGTQLTHTGAFVGTPVYMSPEQAEGRADARSDVWSMAVMAFECVTGTTPFAGDSLPALLRAICYDPVTAPSQLAAVPPGFDDWFLRAVSRDPAARQQTPRQLVDELLPLLELPRDDWVSAPAGSAPTLKLKAAALGGDRRSEARIPSSIPAGLNRQRDLHHAALVYNASRTGALLGTRLACQPGQGLLLTLQLDGSSDGETIAAHVVRVEARASDSLWKYQVAVRFEAPLGDDVLGELERRSRDRRSAG